MLDRPWWNYFTERWSQEHLPFLISGAWLFMSIRCTASVFRHLSFSTAVAGVYKACPIPAFSLPQCFRSVTVIILWLTQELGSWWDRFYLCNGLYCTDFSNILILHQNIVILINFLVWSVLFFSFLLFVANSFTEFSTLQSLIFLILHPQGQMKTSGFIRSRSEYLTYFQRVK